MTISLIYTCQGKVVSKIKVRTLAVCLSCYGRFARKKAAQSEGDFIHFSVPVNIAPSKAITYMSR